jgi:hypothetical protein
MVEIYGRFGGTCCLYFQGKVTARLAYPSILNMERVRNSETSVIFYQA